MRGSLQIQKGGRSTIGRVFHFIMNKKQIAGLVTAAAVFVFVGVSSAVTNVWESKSTKAATEMYSSMFDNSVTLPATGDYIARVNIDGEIADVETTSIFGTTVTTGYNHSFTMDYVDDLIESDNNVGILLYVDTPGGAVTTTDEIYLKLMKYKEETGRPIYCYFGDMACSGGYYAAMAADEIYANRNTWTGSIGVICSVTNLSGLYEKLGIEEINITSGANKDMGSAGKPMTDEHYEILQSLVDEAYDQFVGVICEGRDMNDKTVRKLADGRIYSAKQALEAELVDGISMSYEEYENQVLGYFSSDVTIHNPKSAANSFSMFFSGIQDIFPKSETEMLTELASSREGEVLKYYAEISK